MTLSATSRSVLSCGLLMPCLLATALAGWGQRHNIGWGPGYHAGDYRGVRYGSAWTDYRPPGAPARGSQCDCPRCRSAAPTPPAPTLAPGDLPLAEEAEAAEALPAEPALPSELALPEELPPAERWPDELPPRDERAPAPDETRPAPQDSGDDVLDLIESLFQDR